MFHPPLKEIVLIVVHIKGLEGFNDITFIGIVGLNIFLAFILGTSMILLAH